LRTDGRKDGRTKRKEGTLLKEGRKERRKEHY
jgi:hypothetical protein